MVDDAKWSDGEFNLRARATYGADELNALLPQQPPGPLQAESDAGGLG